MVILYCITTSVLLITFQERCRRKHSRVKKSSAAVLKRKFATDNNKLDADISGLLFEHRRLSKSDDELSDYLVTDELEEAFKELEEKMRQEGKL